MILKAAVIDIGTNSCRLLIAEKASPQSLEILKRGLEITRLGEGVDKNKKLKKEAVKRVVAALKKYKKIIDQYQLNQIRVVGTSALRDVKNSELLAEEIKKLGFNLKIISGQKEAEFNYLGAVSDLKDDFLLIDIGGGSTEFVWPEAGELNFKSLDVGCVRMTERYISNPEAEIKIEQLNKMKNNIYQLLNNELSLNENYKIKGVGGTITTLAAIKLEMEVYDSEKIENLKVEKNELNEVIKKLASLPLKKRKKIKGLQPKRADIITAGLVILDLILDYVDSDDLYVSDHDLLYGLLKNELLIK